MANDKEKKEKQENQEQDQSGEEQSKDDGKKSSSFGLSTWIILVAIIFAGATGGFALAQLIAGSTSEPVVEEKPQDGKPAEVQTFEDLVAKADANAKPWVYELEPVVANLDEPGVTRYGRVAITIELSAEMDPEKGAIFLDEKKLLLRDWLTTYIAGLSLERVRGTRNLSRIKKEIRDHFNELLFAESKPFVQTILFKEFAIQ